MGIEYKFYNSLLVLMCFVGSCFCHDSMLVDKSAHMLHLNLGIGWPSPVTVEMSRDYDPKIQGRRCYHIANVNKFAHETSLEHWPTIPKEEIVDAVFAAWWYVRYKMAPYIEVSREEENVNLRYSFHKPVGRSFSIKQVCSTNMFVHVFPFKVKNPVSTYVERVCLVSFRDGNGFLFGIYVDLNTGNTGLNFWNVVDRSELLFESVAEYPFLTNEEFKAQEEIIRRINLTSNPLNVSGQHKIVSPRKSSDFDVEVKVDID